jgi:putative FmdB family regulatory protein
MPIYTYHCEKCEHEFEKFQTFAEDPLSICPECQEEALRKVYKPALVLFKGSGYYVTDNKSAKSSLNSVDKKPASDNGSGDSKGESKPDEPKKSKTKETSESKAEK